VGSNLTSLRCHAMNIQIAFLSSFGTTASTFPGKIMLQSRRLGYWRTTLIDSLPPTFHMDEK
jgi:hypothetical protein